VHLHSSIGFVTPHARHVGADLPILAHRRAVHEAARARHPERWTGDIHNWRRPAVVSLNPDRVAIVLREQAATAA
jgi:putative transposase